MAVMSVGDKEALLRRFHESIRAMWASQEWVRLSAIAGLGSGYSATNKLLIWAQASERGWEDSGPVAGYRVAQANGFQVRRGEEGLLIVAPVTRRDPTQPDAPPRVVGFRGVKVFSLLHQCDGPALPSTPSPTTLDDANAPEMVGPIGAWLASRGFDLRFVEFADPGLYGLTDFADHSVAVRAGLPPAGTALVLAHEAAHVILHDPRDPQCPTDTRLRECEAESAAHLTLGLCGLDTSAHSSAYVAAWVNGVGDAGLIASIAHVFRAAEIILGALNNPPSLAITPQTHDGQITPEADLVLT